jgi:AbrB family looped-hinge helix DNA binding protein
LEAVDGVNQMAGTRTGLSKERILARVRIAMSKVTSKMQVTVPKAIAERFGIRPGAEIDWVASGDFIRVVPPSQAAPLDVEVRLKLFDEATRRQRAREARTPREPKASGERGWSREELYERRGAG